VHGDLLLAAEEPQVAVLVGVREVARIEPIAETTSPVACSAFQYPTMRLRERMKIRPTDPDATGSPSSSRSMMSKPLIGGPIEPCLLTPDGGLSVASPTSVIPPRER
jgi:hypothetical protein